MRCKKNEIDQLVFDKIDKKKYLKIMINKIRVKLNELNHLEEEEECHCKNKEESIDTTLE